MAQTSDTVTQNGEVDTTLINSLTVNVSSSGGGAEQKDVNFIDYDGTILYSYTPAEFAALTAMLANPTHAGLTAQGWNWSLEKAKAYVAKYGKLWVGQMYITDDGKTRVYIHLEEGRLAPYLGFGLNGTAVIDWGDGSTATVTGTNVSTVINTQHTYAAAGGYVITINVTGSMNLLGDDTDGSYLLWNNSTGNQNKVYQNAVRQVAVGDNTTIGPSAFNNCCSLASITIPDGVTSIGDSAFQNCYGLSFIRFEPTTPSSVANSNAFGNLPTDCIIYVPAGSLSAYTSATNYPSSSTYTYVEY